MVKELASAVAVVSFSSLSDKSSSVVSAVLSDVFEESDRSDDELWSFVLSRAHRRRRVVTAFDVDDRLDDDVDDNALVVMLAGCGE